MKLSRRTLGLLFPGVAVLLFAQLIIPRTYEPYPAILMPAGGTVLRVDTDTLRFKTYTVAAVHPDGSRSTVSVEELFPFLDNPSVRRRVVLRNFGLRYVGLSERRQQVRLGTFALTLRRVKTTEPAVRETRAWLRRRVETLTGASVDSLIIDHFAYGKTRDAADPFVLEHLDRQVVRLR